MAFVDRPYDGSRPRRHYPGGRSARACDLGRTLVSAQGQVDSPQSGVVVYTPDSFCELPLH